MDAHRSTLVCRWANYESPSLLLKDFRGFLCVNEWPTARARDDFLTAFQRDGCGKSRGDRKSAQSPRQAALFLLQLDRLVNHLQAHKWPELRKTLQIEMFLESSREDTAFQYSLDFIWYLQDITGVFKLKAGLAGCQLFMVVSPGFDICLY